MDYKKCAREIASLLGGRENVSGIYHCMTRLRLVLHDDEKVNMKLLNRVEGVKGAHFQENQLHIILGTGVVTKVYDEFLLNSSVDSSAFSKVEENLLQKQNVFVRAVRKVGDIFIPVLPVMVASGIMTGILLSLNSMFPILETTDVYHMLMLIAQTAIRYLPVLVAVSAAQKFECNPYIAGTFGLLLLHRDLYPASILLEGASVPVWDLIFTKVYAVSYEGHILPVIVGVYAMSHLEKWLHKHMPDSLDSFLTPVITLLVVSVGTLVFTGPVLKTLETNAMKFTTWVLEFPYGIGSAIAAAVFPLSVILGIQHIFTILEAQMLAETGANIWIRIVSCANIAMSISCLTVAFKTQSKKLKSIAYPAGISAAFGITEPAIFGINFRYQAPFICGMIGSAIGSAVGAVLKVYGTSYGISALPGLLLMSPCLWEYCLMLGVTAVVTFGLTWYSWRDFEHLSDEDLEFEEPISLPQQEEEYIYSPIQGTLLPMEDIPDETFSKGYLGNTIGFIPDNGDVIAPFDGTLITITEKKHAIGLCGPQNMNLLIHIGLNTVNLDGSDFTVYVKEGESFKRGEKLLSFDIEKITQKGCDITSAICFINSSEFSEVHLNMHTKTSFGDILYAVK